MASEVHTTAAVHLRQCETRSLLAFFRIKYRYVRDTTPLSVSIRCQTSVLRIPSGSVLSAQFRHSPHRSRTNLRLNSVRYSSSPLTDSTLHEYRLMAPRKPKKALEAFEPETSTSESQQLASAKQVYAVTLSLWRERCRGSLCVRTTLGPTESKRSGTILQATSQRAPARRWQITSTGSKLHRRLLPPLQARPPHLSLPSTGI